MPPFMLALAPGNRVSRGCPAASKIKFFGRLSFKKAAPLITVENGV
jgi:hypothetical protein